ncbi:hypothetical protein REPUB_Repub15cG0090400 [Reevesia pubescens]
MYNESTTSTSEFDFSLLESIRQYLLEDDSETQSPASFLGQVDAKDEFPFDAISVDQWITFDQLFNEAETADVNVSFPSSEATSKVATETDKTDKDKDYH